MAHLSHKPPSMCVAIKTDALWVRPPWPISGFVLSCSVLSCPWRVALPNPKQDVVQKQHTFNMPTTTCGTLRACTRQTNPHGITLRRLQMPQPQSHRASVSQSTLPCSEPEDSSRPTTHVPCVRERRMKQKVMALGRPGHQTGSVTPFRAMGGDCGSWLESSLLHAPNGMGEVASCSAWFLS
jgi:hypothetical protein